MVHGTVNGILQIPRVIASQFMGCSSLGLFDAAPLFGCTFFECLLYVFGPLQSLHERIKDRRLAGRP
jgi:hypothetical protein